MSDPIDPIEIVAKTFCQPPYTAPCAEWACNSCRDKARAVIAALEEAGVINNAALRNLVEEIYEATKGLTMMVPRDIVGKFRASDGNYRVFSIEDWQARARQFLDSAPTFTPPAEERK